MDESLTVKYLSYSSPSDFFLQSETRFGSHKGRINRSMLDVYSH